MSGVNLSDLDLQGSITELEKHALVAGRTGAVHFTAIAESSESMHSGVQSTAGPESTSGKKRPRRKPEHPQRVLDNSDSRGEGGRLSASEEDSLSYSRSSLSKLIPPEEQGASKRPCRGTDAPATPPASVVETTTRNSGKRSGGNASSPAMTLAAAATAALNAAVEKGTVARTIGFEPVCPAAVSPSLQITAQNAAAAQSLGDKLAPGSPPLVAALCAGDTPVGGTSHISKTATKDKTSSSTPAASAAEKDRSKTITAFFAPTNPGKQGNTQTAPPPAVVDINHDSLEGTISEPIFSSRVKSASFAGFTKSPLPTPLPPSSEAGAHDLPADSLRLRAQLEQAQSALKQVTAALSKASADNEGYRDEVARLKWEVEAAQSATSKMDADQEAMRKAVATNLIMILKDTALRDAATFRHTIAENQVRLGRVVPHRTGTSVYEVWEDGEDFLALATQEAQLKMKKTNLEKIQKEIAKRHRKLRGPAEPTKGKKKKTAADDSDDSDDDTAAADTTTSGETENASLLSDLNAANAALSKAMSPFGVASAIISSFSVSGAKLDTMAELDLVEAEENIKCAITAIKREEIILLEKRRSLEAEKALFVLDLKRWKAESMSVWKGNPVLGDPPRYMLLELLGKGGFSEVWRAMDLYEAKEVAVKVHQLAAHWAEDKKRNYVKHAIREYDIQRTLKHPNVVRLFAVIEIDKDCFATVLEYCRGSDLEKLLKSQTMLPEREARAIILQVLSSLRYLNGYVSPWAEPEPPAPPSAGPGTMGPPPAKRKIIHYDLKPANILFDEYRNAKVTDFGLSKIIDEAEHGGDLTSLELTSQGAGTYWYLPPECFQLGSAVRISNKVDVWSVGVIFYQMLYGKRPFGEGQTQEQMLQAGTMTQQAMNGPVFPAKPTVSPDAKTFIRRCLTANVTQRPDVMLLCEDPYLRAKLRSG